eukprot:GEMP01051620.1.p1 GENE.GEMP01051620.1~~GEMP01051620.1.p1  ORF type:complete len:317 (+),score=48.34 GEMP01051620.1:106-1056(+)
MNRIRDWSAQRIFHLTLEELLNAAISISEDPRTTVLLSKILRHPLVFSAMCAYLASISMLSIFFALNGYANGFDFVAFLYSAPTYGSMLICISLPYFHAVEYAKKRLEKLFPPSASEKEAEDADEGPALLRLRIVEDSDASGLYVCVQQKEIVRETVAFGMWTIEEGLALGADALSNGSKETFLFERQETKDGIFLRSQDTNTYMTVLQQAPQRNAIWPLNLFGCRRRASTARGTVTVLNPHTWNGSMNVSSREKFELRRRENEDAKVLFNAYYNVYVRVMKADDRIQVVGVTRLSMASCFQIELVRRSGVGERIG